MVDEINQLGCGRFMGYGLFGKKPYGCVMAGCCMCHARETVEVKMSRFVIGPVSRYRYRYQGFFMKDMVVGSIHVWDEQL